MLIEFLLIFFLWFNCLDFLFEINRIYNWIAYFCFGINVFLECNVCLILCDNYKNIYILVIQLFERDKFLIENDTPHNGTKVNNLW